MNLVYYSIQEKFGTIFGMVSQDDQLNAMIRATQKMATELEKPDQCLVERENVLGAVKTELAELSAQFVSNLNKSLVHLHLHAFEICDCYKMNPTFDVTGRRLLCRGKCSPPSKERGTRKEACRT